MTVRSTSLNKRRLWLGAFGIALALFAGLLLNVLPTQSTTVPAPSNVEVDDVATGMKVTWDQPDLSNTTYRREFASYKIERREGSQGTWKTLVDNTNATVRSNRAYTDTSGNDSGPSQGRFEAGIAYLYRVTALYLDGDGVEYESSPSHHGYDNAPIYPKPISLSRSAGSTGVTLRWVASSMSWTNQSVTRTGYEIRITRTTDQGLTTSYVTTASDATSYGDGDGDWTTRYQIKAIYGVFESWEGNFPIGVDPNETE